MSPSTSFDFDEAKSRVVIYLHQNADMEWLQFVVKNRRAK